MLVAHANAPLDHLYRGRSQGIVAKDVPGGCRQLACMQSLPTSRPAASFHQANIDTRLGHLHT